MARLTGRAKKSERLVVVFMVCINDVEPWLGLLVVYWVRRPFNPAL